MKRNKVKEIKEKIKEVIRKENKDDTKVIKYINHEIDTLIMGLIFQHSPLNSRWEQLEFG